MYKTYVFRQNICVLYVHFDESKDNNTFHGKYKLYKFISHDASQSCNEA